MVLLVEAQVPGHAVHRPAELHAKGVGLAADLGRDGRPLQPQPAQVEQAAIGGGQAPPGFLQQVPRGG
jgi:hypothetical protein